LLLMRLSLPIMAQAASIAARASDKNRGQIGEVKNACEKA